VIQAYIYSKNGNSIDMDEWKGYARKNVNTTLGQKILFVVMDKIIAEPQRAGEKADKMEWI